MTATYNTGPLDLNEGDQIPLQIDAGGHLKTGGDPAFDYVEVTPSGTALADGPCRAILCSEDGALDLTTINGDVRASVFVQKGYNPLRAAVIDEPTAGTAPGTVIALY